MEEEDDEFEIISKAELEELKKEVDDVRKNPFGDTATGRTLLESMEKLNGSINKLIQIFEDANEEIIKEYQESKPAEKLNQILDQNEKIAEGVVALADLMNKPEEPKQQIMSPFPQQFTNLISLL